jgi:sarcosine oxidase, subunit gamma
MSTPALWLREPVSAQRVGLKGARAAAWLEQRGFCVPPHANTWAPLRAQDRDDSANVIARLGHTEFFLDAADGSLAQVESSLRDESGVYPVLRADAAFLLGGAHATQALAEVCNVDFAAQRLAAKPVLMTLMAGVGVLVLPQSTDQGLVYRIWCDPSLGSYLWETLAEVVMTTTGRAA